MDRNTSVDSQKKIITTTGIFQFDELANWSFYFKYI